MDQEKIGKFIAKLRKDKKMTQFEMAQKLNVSDRAISNWENGKNMPDLSLFNPLCKILDISINELLNGEKIEDDNIKQKSDEIAINTIDYANNILKKNKKKMKRKIIITIICFIISLSVVFGLSDYQKIKNGENPNFMIRISDGGKSTQYYIGLGYMMERNVGVSYKEPLISDNYIRFGFWVFTWNINVLDVTPDDLFLISNSSGIKANMGSYCWTVAEGTKSSSVCADSIDPISMKYDDALQTNKNDKITFSLKDCTDCNIKKITLYEIPNTSNKSNITDYLVNYNVLYNNDLNYIITPNKEGTYIMVIDFISNKGHVWYSLSLKVE